MLLVTVLGGACCHQRVASSVTCAGIRALRPGMDEAAVERLLGPPIEAIPVPLSTDYGPPMAPAEEGDLLWRYDSRHGVALSMDNLTLYFRNGELIGGDGYFKALFGERTRTLFDLYKDPKARDSRRFRLDEAEEFEAAFCPDEIRSP